ncbi:MAG: sulfotransferase [Planctomycetaceae bacterium]
MTSVSGESADSRPKPGFFLIGAPKGGTTALAHYLSEHPRVFFSAPKELHFWDEDHEHSRRVHGVWSLQHYLEYFRDADPGQHDVIGEGSTTYLQSEVAVKSILDFNPQAKFLVMLRNPVEVAQAMHGELVRHYHEDVTDFEAAWRLQPERAAGRRMPGNPAFTQQLQYQEVATFAPQLQRLFDAVPQTQRMVVIFDDFVTDTAGVYRDVLRFLNLEDDGRTEFPKVNQARTYRLGWLGRLYHAPPKLIERPMRALRSRINANSGPFKEAIRRVVSVNQPRTGLRPEFVQELRGVFREDVALTSEMLGRDLSHWTAETSERKTCQRDKNGVAASVEQSLPERSQMEMRR